MVSKSGTIPCVGLLAILIALPVRGQTPLGTSFVYQGRLEQTGVAVDTAADFEFRLFESLNGGVQIGAMAPFFDVPVVDGLFTVTLDFGTSAFTGDARWLQIAVRSTDGAPFTTLSPRHPLAATPYVLRVRGIDGHSLDAADGSPTDALFVNSSGNVGIGTSTPAKKLTIAGDVEIGTHTADYRHLRIGGGNCSGFLYGSYPAWADGIHMGYNYYADAAGVHRFIASDGQTSRISMGYGYVALATGATNQVPVNRLTVTTAGNIGLGTDGPAAKLDVRGNIKLRPSGQYFAPSSGENLRIVRGTIDGNGSILQGSEFTATRLSEGQYTIQFTQPFASAPSVTVTPYADANFGWRYGTITNGGPTASQFTVYVNEEGGPGTDSDFAFCAIGPR